MANYKFETITAAEALAVSSADSLSIGTAFAKNTTVLFLADGTYSVTAGDRTVIFGSYFPTLAPRIQFPDDSALFVGGTSGDVRDPGVLPSTGAMYGGDGADTLTGGSGDWLIQGNQGDDNLIGRSAGSNTIYGGQGNDVITISINGTGHQQFVQGNKGDDRLQGGVETDTLLGGQGNDNINGGGGSDFINGNLGNDQISGAGRLFGEDGNDTLGVSGGIDSTVSGGEGNDSIQVGSVGDVVARNVVHGDGGNDTIGALTDTIDQLYGDAGDDRIQLIQNAAFGAVSQTKLLDGGTGNDTLIGSGGAETLSGGDGADQLFGGAAADVFVASTAQALTRAAADTINDWSADDFLKLRAAIGSAYAEASAVDFDAALKVAQDQIAGGQIEAVAIQVGVDVVVFADASPGTTVDSIMVLVGRALSDIAPGDFL